jgi:Ca2+-binding EF-hand superfamily protein
MEKDKMDIFGQEAEDVMPKWRHDLTLQLFCILDFDQSGSVDSQELAEWAQMYKNDMKGRSHAKFSVKRAKKLLQKIDIDGECCSTVHRY